MAGEQAEMIRVPATGELPDGTIINGSILVPPDHPFAQQPPETELETE